MGEVREVPDAGAVPSAEVDSHELLLASVPAPVLDFFLALRGAQHAAPHPAGSAFARVTSE